MADRRILVIGASGRTGKPVVAALARRGLTVRAFVRKPEQAAALAALGAGEHALGDLTDAASVRAALEGCDAVVYIGPPMHPDEVAFVERIIAAAKDAGVGHLIYYSVMHPLRRDVRHHRLKLDASETLVESGLPYTILEPSRYMQHLEPIWAKVRDEGVHRMPFATDRRFSVADLEDLAEAVAEVASEPGHLYATYELAGPEVLSSDEMAAILSEVLGRPVRAEAIPLDELEATARRNGLSDDRVAQMLSMNRHYDAHGMPGNGNVLRWLLGREPARYRDYVARRLAADRG